MKRKFMLVVTFVSIILAISLIVFTVYASLNQNLKIQHQIGFVSNTNIYVSLDCEVKNSVQANYTEAPDGFASLEEYRSNMGIENSVVFDETKRGEEQDLGVWNIYESMEFKDIYSPIEYCIEVTNYSSVAITVDAKSISNVEGRLENILPDQIQIEGYDFENNVASSAVIVIKSYIAEESYSSSFKKLQNNFTITFNAVIIEN